MTKEIDKLPDEDMELLYQMQLEMSYNGVDDYVSGYYKKEARLDFELKMLDDQGLENLVRDKVRAIEKDDPFYRCEHFERHLLVKDWAYEQKDRLENWKERYRQVRELESE